MNVSYCRKLMSIIFVGAVALVGVACQKTSGGGWVDSVVSGKKATYGYQASCTNIEYSPGFFVGHVTGQFQYKDHGAGIAFHGDVDFIPYEEDSIFTSCEAIGQYWDSNGFVPVFLMAGTYTPIPANQGTGGVFAVLAGDQVCEGGDAIVVDVYDGFHGGYFNESCLGGGNLTVFKK